MPPSASCARLKLSQMATMISPITTSLVFIATRRRTRTPSCRRYLLEKVLNNFLSNASRVIRFMIFRYFFRKCSRLNGRICCQIHTRKPKEERIDTMTSQNQMKMKIFSLNRFTGSTHWKKAKHLSCLGLERRSIPVSYVCGYDQPWFEFRSHTSLLEEIGLNGNTPDRITDY